MSSKLATVRAALAARSDLVILDEDVKVFLPNPRGYFSQEVTIVTAPASGIYVVDELQELMMGLVPIQATQKDDFRGHEGSMSFGVLYFDEVIGTDVHVGTRTLTLTDPDIEAPSESVDGVQVIDLASTKDVLRRTWVRVYPDLACAERALEGDDKFSTRKLIVPA